MDSSWKEGIWILEKCDIDIKTAEEYIQELEVLPIYHWEPEIYWRPPGNPKWKIIGRFDGFDEMYSYWTEDFNKTLDSLSRQSSKIRKFIGLGSNNNNGKSLRFDILKRDNYRCQICGRDASDGVKLEIDHKVPKSKGGQDTYENLWTLCYDCNRGKSTKSL
jgi:hypothetical protein